MSIVLKSSLTRLLRLLLSLQRLERFDFLLFFGLIPALVLQPMQYYALHNALRGHIVARVDQLKDGSSLGHSVWINFPILQTDRCASMANNVYLEVIQQLLSDTVGCTNDHLVDKLRMQRKQILVQTRDMSLSSLHYLLCRPKR